VTLAGQVGVAGHLTIGDDARVAAQSGVSGNVEPRADLLGSPAIPIEKAKRSVYVFQNLPDWVKRIKDLEREVKELREKTESTQAPLRG
jgi:UDP-3-O-[3-hydroxymyristoyl] glucosamine N-acyltransferase